MDSSHLEVQLRIDAERRSPLRRIWRFVGYDEVNYTYTPAGRELLAKLGRMGDAPYYIRTHYLLCSGDGKGRPKWGSSNVYTEDPAGKAIYDWRIIDRVFDTYLEAGCAPFVELGFMPQALSTAPSGTPYDTLRDGGWRYPPKDYVRWQELVRELAQHCLERYGLREVSRWYWELWNEPDIFYWAGTLEEYCRLYDHTVAGLLAVLPQARVGGPGTTNPDRPEASAFLRGFLEHCTRGQNAVAGQRGTRLDFISFHSKGAGYRPEAAAEKQTPTIYRLIHNILTGLAAVAEFPELHGREVILTECDPDGMAAYGKHENANLVFRNTNYYASYLASAACKLLDLGPHPHRIDGMLTWAFQFEDRELFEGLRTLSTRGIDKPVLNTFRLLAELGGLRLHLSCDGSRPATALQGPDGPDDPPDVAALAAINGRDELQVLLVSHHDDWDVHTPSLMHVSIKGLAEGATYRIERMGVDKTRGNAHTVWQEMGEPQQPTVAQLAHLRRSGMPTREDLGVLAVQGGELRLNVELPDHSVHLLRLRPL